MNIKSVCVYCGSSGRVSETFKQVAHDVGTALGQRGMRIIYGGSTVGLMGTVADAALQTGTEVVGIIPRDLQKREIRHDGLTQTIEVNNMHERKMQMVKKSDAFVVLPGGFGTLDETFEILTWKQIQFHDKPIIIYNAEGYWNKMLQMLDHIVETHFARPSDLKLFEVVDKIPDLVAALSHPLVHAEDIKTKWM